MFVRAPLAAAAFCAQRAQPAWASSVSESLHARGTPTLMPGRVLTHPCPGTGRRLRSSESPPPPPLSYQRARHYASPSSKVAVAIHPSWLADGSGALVGVRRSSALARLAANSRCALGAGARPPMLREHGSVPPPASLRGLVQRESASSRACDTTLARQRRRWRDRRTRAPTDCAVRRVSRSGYASRSCEAGPALSATSNRTDCPGAVGRDSEISVRCTPFRTARRPAPSLRSFATSAAH